MCVSSKEIKIGRRELLQVYFCDISLTVIYLDEK
jgi:hypothetical protein